MKMCARKSVAVWIAPRPATGPGETLAGWLEDAPSTLLGVGG